MKILRNHLMLLILFLAISTNAFSLDIIREGGVGTISLKLTSSESFSPKKESSLMQNGLVWTMMQPKGDLGSWDSSKKAQAISSGSIVGFSVPVKMLIGTTIKKISVTLASEAPMKAAFLLGSEPFTLNGKDEFTVSNNSFKTYEFDVDKDVTINKESVSALTNLFYLALQTSTGKGYIRDITIKYSTGSNFSRIGFSPKSATYYLGEESELPRLVSKSVMPVFYQSSNPSVASVNNTSGVVTPSKAGKATITAYYYGNANNLPTQASYELTVKDEVSAMYNVLMPSLYGVPVVMNNGDKMTLLYADRLFSGNQLYALGAQGKSNFGKVDGVFTSVRCFRNDLSGTLFTLVIDEDGKKYFQLKDGSYLTCTANQTLTTTTNKEEAEVKIVLRYNKTEEGTNELVRSLLINGFLITYDKESGTFVGYNPDDILSKKFLGLTQLTPYIAKRIDAEVTIGETGYSTLFYGQTNLRVPSGVTASTYKVEDGVLKKSFTYNPGDIIRKSTGVVLNAKAGTYKFYSTTEEETSAIGYRNMLQGSDLDSEIGNNTTYYYYMLSLNSSSDPESVGFYWGADNGDAFTNKSHKAYLVVPRTAFTSGAKEVLLFGEESEEVTAIQNVETDKASADNSVYNLAGQKVADSAENLPAGLYIVGGKKILVK